MEQHGGQAGRGPAGAAADIAAAEEVGVLGDGCSPAVSPRHRGMREAPGAAQSAGVKRPRQGPGEAGLGAAAGEEGAEESGSAKLARLSDGNSAASLSGPKMLEQLAELQNMVVSARAATLRRR